MGTKQGAPIAIYLALLLQEDEHASTALDRLLFDDCVL